jgi:hypothetical protein
LLQFTHKCEYTDTVISSPSPRETTLSVFVSRGIPMSNQSLTIGGFIISHIGWVVAVISLSITLFTVMITLGILKQKIATAALAADRFKRELYSEEGVTNYIPRKELKPMLDKIEERVRSVRTEFFNNCAQIRAECRDAVCLQLNLIRQENRQVHHTIEALEEKYHDQALGMVALSTQLSLLLKQQGIQKPDEIADIERRLMKSASNRARRHTEDNLLTEGGDANGQTA